ncbi:MAG TPA: sulfatase, partial [Polyangiaceae bacterium LLY-WYZ-15_(1-7)]|nr:sulfatase [Polyangiaceae bacterium LLY-WYZ-15_(1-7)]
EAPAEAPAGEGDEGAPEGEGEPSAAAPAPAGEPAIDGRVHLDLLELAHLADVDHHGLYVDFGTQARFKYTSGQWNSGWGSDGADGDALDPSATTFSRFGRMGRVYFDVRDPGVRTLHLKLRSVGGGGLLAFLNGEALPETPFEGEGWQDITLEAPASVVRRGENYLLLRGTETRRVDGEDVAFELAEMHVARSRPEGWEAPRHLRGRHAVGGSERDALQIPAETTLSWYLEVPEGAALVFGRGATAGEGRVTVTATPEGGASRELFAGATGSRWADERVDLGPLAGELVRLDVQATGAGAALSGMKVVLPAVELAALGSDEAPHAQNVVVLTIDTLRASKLRPYNRRSRVRTPAFDAFAEESTLFENAQTAENWTKPAVASILTSLFPATHGAKNDSSRLPQSALTLGEIYQREGFQTASFLANGYVSRAFGFDQGWDHYTNYIREQRNTNASNVFGEAAEWIEEHHEDGRFFVYIQTIDPHVPYDPPDDYLRMYDARTDYAGQVQNRRTHLLLEDAKKRPPRVTFDESDVRRLTALHDGEISYHDHHFGRFLEKLEELGLKENTIFVVTSDHGEEFDEHGSWGHGHSIFQELLHVPLVVRYPGVGRAGARVPQVVSTMGVAPTVLEATGVDVPGEFEGRSLMGFLRGAPPPGPWIAFSDFQENRRVVRGMDWKLVLRSSLTYVLFDLERDPGEQNEDLDPRRHPIAMRYLRVLSGQQLGATDRSRWLTGGGGASRVQAENADMTLELCQQLIAIGYMDCLSQFPDAM